MKNAQRLMPTDLVATHSPSLSPRASIALLTLQLRTALQEAAAAEAEEADIDQNLAVGQLRAQLASLAEERRFSLDGTLAVVRAEAAAAIGAAGSEAAAIVAAAVTASPAVLPPPTGIGQTEMSRPLPPPSIDLAARVEIAQLNLRLRESLEEAADAEAEAAALDRDEPHAQFSARLQPLIEERRRLLAVELAEAQAEAAAAVAAARHEASTIVAEATPSDSQTDRRDVEVVSIAPRTLPMPMPMTTALAQWREQPAVLPPPNSIVVDTNALAQIIAGVVATLLDERLPTWRDGGSAVSAGNPSIERRSYLAGARLLDVLLVGLAMAIVLVILAAWLV